MKHETLVSGGQPICVSGSVAYINLSNSQQILESALVMYSSDRDICPIGDGTPMAEDAAQGSGYMVSESSNHSSLEKMRYISYLQMCYFKILVFIFVCT